MNIKSFTHIYLLGIGGIGMSALARYFVSQNKKVYGYDKVKSELTLSLEGEGIDISYSDNINTIPSIFNTNDISNQLVIYSSAISDNRIYDYFSSNSFNICKRAQALGWISQHFYTIAIAGTHGKTTTSIMLAHILKRANVDCTAFLGGMSQNYNTNFLLSNENNYMVVEADEYDRSFLYLNPNIAIITSLDSDHLDIYGNHNELISSFKKFASQVKDDGYLIIEESISEHFSSPKNGELHTYSNSTKSDYYFKDVTQNINKVEFSFGRKDRIFDNNNKSNNVVLSMPGEHNISNALAAIVASSCLNIKDDIITNAISSFNGVKRRFDVHLCTDNKVFIDDYAHHPKEVISTIKTVKHLFPQRLLTVVFQPHLYSRTQDFAREFADALSSVDNLIILDIYPAREVPITGVDSEMLLNLCSNFSKITCKKNNLVSVLSSRDLDVLLTLGAGDISDLVNPIKEILI